MGQDFSYVEYMGDQEIPDSFDGLDEDRILFEKKIKFLILLQKFGTFCFFGSAKHKNADKIKITRTDIKNYLESFDIKEHVDWINEVLPNKVVNMVKKSDFIDWNLEKNIKKDTEYLDKINPKKCELVKEIYSTLDNDDKVNIFKRLIDKYSDHIDKNEIFKMYINLCGPKDNTDNEIKIFFDKLSEFDKYKIKDEINYVVKKIDNHINKKRSQIFKFMNAITWVERFEFFNNNSDFYKELYSYEDGIRKKINNDFEPDEKVKFVDDYFINADQDKLIKIYEDYSFNKIFRDKIRENEDYRKFEFDVKYNLLKTKYFDELDEKKKNELTEYKLDYNSHYELFKLNEKKYMEILLGNDQIDDYTFNHWDFDNYEYLDKFNEEVKTYLKNKIYADSNFNCI